jgi:hypothetical protein
MQELRPTMELMRMLAQRLERLSVDSHWAHRASGVRGNLLRIIDSMEAGIEPQETEKMIEMAFDILRKGARELRGKGQ